MPVILPVEDKHPQFGDNCFIAPNATIVGNVTPAFIALSKNVVQRSATMFPSGIMQ